jgi:hypothetical protein
MPVVWSTKYESNPLALISFMLKLRVSWYTIAPIISKWPNSSVPTGVSEMFHSKQTAKKPCDTRLLIHSIRTANKLKKYDGKAEITANVTDGKSERTINLFIV